MLFCSNFSTVAPLFLSSSFVALIVFSWFLVCLSAHLLFSRTGLTSLISAGLVLLNTANVRCGGIAIVF